MPTPLLIQNFLLFQLGWFVCVLAGGYADYYMVGVASVILIVAIHLVRANKAVNELLLITAATVLGTFWDSILLMASLYKFHAGIIVNGIVPVWLIAMWALFATTLNISMNWLKQRYLLAAVLGAIFGPAAYYAGHRLGAVDFPDTQSSLLAIAAGWTVIMPALMLLSEYFNGYSRHDLQPQGVKTS